MNDPATLPLPPTAPAHQPDRRPHGRVVRHLRNGGRGRPPGSRNKLAAFLDEVGSRSMLKLVNVTIDKAEQGDMRAAQILFDRFWPAPKGRTVQFDMPPIRELAELVTAHAALVAAVAGGRLTPQEGASVAAMLDTLRKTIEMVELERRVEALEKESVEIAATAKQPRAAA